jgi:hypothetical protein
MHYNRLCLRYRVKSCSLWSNMDMNIYGRRQRNANMARARSCHEVSNDICRTAVYWLCIQAVHVLLSYSTRLWNMIEPR